MALQAVTSLPSPDWTIWDTTLTWCKLRVPTALHIRLLRFQNPLPAGCSLKASASGASKQTRSPAAVIPRHTPATATDRTSPAVLGTFLRADIRLLKYKPLTT